jgi:hypothetical protein
MITENLSPKRVRYGHYEGYETRIQRRLHQDLGIDAAAVEAILHLRSQVIALQSHIHQLETELAAHESNQQMRLAQYCEVYCEATWVELKLEQ